LHITQITKYVNREKKDYTELHEEGHHVEKKNSTSQPEHQ